MGQLTLKLSDGSELGVYELELSPCLRDRLIVDGREMVVTAVEYLGTPPAVAAATLVAVDAERGHGDPES